VTQLKESDGGPVGTYAVGAWPYGMAFDGANVWVVSWLGNRITKL